MCHIVPVTAPKSSMAGNYSVLPFIIVRLCMEKIEVISKFYC